jgi:hypothetical protein
MGTRWVEGLEQDGQAVTPDRRRLTRCSTGAEPERRHLVSMILGTYREMPGLYLSLHQAARFFGLRPTTCQIVMEDLVRTRHLRHTSDGRYTGL